MDVDLAGGAQSSPRRNTIVSRACQGASFKEGEAANGIALSRKAMKGGDMAQIRTCTVQQRREEVYTALQ